VAQKKRALVSVCVDVGRYAIEWWEPLID
jgi:hypothetical protein